MNNTQSYVKELMGKDVELELNGKCHDCKEQVSYIAYKENDNIKITGPFWHIEGVGDFTKCMPCFEKDEILRNFRPCEVFSRVCGYLRPIRQWNSGKREEFSERINFKL